MVKTKPTKIERDARRMNERLLRERKPRFEACMYCGLVVRRDHYCDRPGCSTRHTRAQP
jgi:hypothetical protein